MREYAITAAFKKKRELTTVLRPTKDKLNKSEHCNIMYVIWCKGRNCRAVYIGQTKRPLRVRVDENKKNINKEPKKHNALAKHTVQDDHFFDFENAKILANESHYRKRLVFEMCHIPGNDDAVNLRTDLENLSKIYYPVIKTV